MALGTFDKVKPVLLKHEGGYVDHPRDPGGATNMGITQGTLSGWRRRKVTKAEVRDLSVDEALAIYKARYWDTVLGDQLPAGVDYATYDFAVNSGPSRAVKYLQRIVGATADGVAGPMTLQAVESCGLSSAQIVERLCDARLAFMKRLRTWSTFGKGWSARVREVKKVSVRLAEEGEDWPELLLRKSDDEIATIADAEAPPSEGKAVAADTAAWKTPEGLATGATAMSGVGGMVSNSAPVLQYAFAAVFVIAALAVGYYVMQKVKEE